MTDKDPMADVRAAVKKLAKAEQATKAARDDLGDKIAAALLAGVRPTDLEPVVPYNREHIRRIARAHNVPPLREATVVSKRSTDETAR
ncbi:MAG TPA: hypothetical protein VFQ42_04290 [Mycobacterium sp.]|nr:hypothetical protein [Mycobacterium sp.]